MNTERLQNLFNLSDIFILKYYNDIVNTLSIWVYDRMKDEKAMSPVVGIMLMIAITIVLGVILIFFATAFEMQEPAPFVVHSSGELVRDVDGADDQKIYLYHEGGDPIKVSDIEIVVDATKCCGMKDRIVNLPARDSNMNPKLGEQNIAEDSDLISKTTNYCGGAIAKEYFSVGEKLWFRINNGQCSLEKGDQITVKIIHTPTNTIVIEETLTAS